MAMVRMRPQWTYAALVGGLLVLTAVVALLLRVLFGMSTTEEDDVPTIVEDDPGIEVNAMAKRDLPPREPEVTPPPPTADTIPADPLPTPPKMDDPVEPAPVDAPPPAEPKLDIDFPSTIARKPADDAAADRPAIQLRGKGSIAAVRAGRGGAVLYPDPNDPSAFHVMGVNSELGLHERVETVEDARFRFHFSDGTVLRVGGRTIFVLDDYRYDPADPKNNRISLRLVEGDIRIQPGAIGRNTPDRTIVRTRMARAEVGTADMVFHSKLDGDDYAVLRIGQTPVKVYSTRTGEILMNTATGKRRVTDEKQIVVATVTDSQRRITIADGFPARQAPMSLSSTRHISGLTDHYEEAKYTASMGPAAVDIHLDREPMIQNNRIQR